MSDVPAVTPELTLPKLLLQQAQRHGARRVALREKEFGIWQSFTWADYLRHVREFSLGLAALGVQRGDKVAVVVGLRLAPGFPERRRLGSEAFHLDIVTVRGDGSDVKIPWELSRAQHLPVLGQAWHLAPHVLQPSRAGEVRRRCAAETVAEIDDWIGSENHNWGTQHTDSYAWGQVAGFDGEPQAFLEVITAQVRIGPIWTPRLTLRVLRLGDDEIRLNGFATALAWDPQTFPLDIVTARGDGSDVKIPWELVRKPI